MWKNVKAPNPTWQALRNLKKGQILVKDFDSIIYDRLAANPCKTNVYENLNNSLFLSL